MGGACMHTKSRPFFWLFPHIFTIKIDFRLCWLNINIRNRNASGRIIEIIIGIVWWCHSHGSYFTRIAVHTLSRRSKSYSSMIRFLFIYLWIVCHPSKFKMLEIAPSFLFIGTSVQENCRRSGYRKIARRINKKLMSNMHCVIL